MLGSNNSILVIFPRMVDSAKGVSRATELSQPALVGELDFPLCGEPAETTLKEWFLEKKSHDAQFCRFHRVRILDLSRQHGQAGFVLLA